MPLVKVSLQQPTTFSSNTTSLHKPLVVAAKHGFNAAPHQQAYSGVKIELNASHHQQTAPVIRPQFNASHHQQLFTPEQVDYLPTPQKKQRNSSGSTWASETFGGRSASKKRSTKALVASSAPQSADDMDANAPNKLVNDDEPPAKKSWFCC